MIFLSKIKVFLFNGVLLTLTSIFLKSIDMFFSIYISNKIGSEAVGVYGLIMSVYMLFITLANSGTNLAASRIVSEQMAYNSDTGMKSAIKKCITYSLIMGLLSFLLLFTFSSYISTYWLHEKISSLPLKIIAISLPFLSVSSSINGYFSAIRNIKKTAYAQILEQLLKITFVVFFMNLFMPLNIEYACIGLVLGSCISEVASFLLLYIFYIKNIKLINSKNCKRENFAKQILRIVVPIAFTSYIRSGLSTLKQILIPIRLEKSGISCEKALSQYGIVNGMAMPLIMFPCLFISSFSMLLIPEFSYLNAKRSFNKINYAINKIFKFCFIFSFLIMGIFWCFSTELSAYIYKGQDVSIFIKVLSPLIVLMYVDNIVDSILKGLDKQISVMGINILDLLTSITFIYFLLPINGIKGYIIVLFISEFLNGIISLLLLLKQTHLNFDFINWLFKPSLAIFFINFLFKNYPCNTLSDLILQIILFCICYFVVIILLKGLVKEDFNEFCNSKNLYKKK